MATSTTYYGMSKPTLLEAADIRVINGDIDTIDRVMHSHMLSMAPVFDTTSTYAVGDLVMYNDILYRCKTAISTAGAWDSTKWDATTVVDEMPEDNNVDYSTTEQNTGVKWIDGKDIYQIVISDTMPVISTDGVNADKFIASTPANIDTLVDLKVKALSTVGNVFMAPYLTASGYALRAFYNVENNRNQVQVSGNHTMWSECACTIILQYTKVTTP